MRIKQVTNQQQRATGHGQRSMGLAKKPDETEVLHNAHVVVQGNEGDLKRRQEGAFSLIDCN